jgi:hypothetical protein
METPLIRYNLQDRGRTHTGQERNFNVKAIADAINSKRCQETVKTRGMVGYFGHLPRIRFGMNPMEGGIDGQKYVPVEPAFVTTYLKASYDGTVEHRAEFLDTASGQIAAKMFQGKVGGFSSAIDQARPEFYGMDYVNAPNYLDNSFRGIVLDDAYGGKVHMTYDDIYAAELDERLQAFVNLLDSANSEREQANSIIEHLRFENDELLTLLAKAGVSDKSLDSAFVKPLLTNHDIYARMQRDSAKFRKAELPAFVKPIGIAEPSFVEDRLLSKFGV